MKWFCIIFFIVGICQNTFSQDTLSFEQKVALYMKNRKPETIFSFIDSTIPNCKLLTLNGDSLEVNQWKGKVTVINFWFSNCAPCLAEMPVLSEIQSKFSDTLVNFVAMTFEDAAKVEKIQGLKKFYFEHIVEAKSYIDLLGVKQYPKTLILSKDLTLMNVVGPIRHEFTKEDIESWKIELTEKIQKCLE